jgi:hypothetical protein
VRWRQVLSLYNRVLLRVLYNYNVNIPAYTHDDSTIWILSHLGPKFQNIFFFYQLAMKIQTSMKGHCNVLNQVS